MRHLRRFCAVITLLCAISFSAYAGNIECDVKAQPPTPEEIASGIQSEAESPLTDALLILIESVLVAP